MGRWPGQHELCSGPMCRVQPRGQHSREVCDRWTLGHRHVAVCARGGAQEALLAWACALPRGDKRAWLHLARVTSAFLFPSHTLAVVQENEGTVSVPRTTCSTSGGKASVLHLENASSCDLQFQHFC